MMGDKYAMQLDVYRRLIMNSDLLSVLRSSNFRGNAMTDEDALAQMRWSVPELADLCHCDAVTLWKMSDLMNQGVPAGPLLFTVCRNGEDGYVRSILCVSTDQGDYVLDRMLPDIITYEQARDDGCQMLYRTAVTDSIDELCRVITSYRS